MAAPAVEIDIGTIPGDITVEDGSLRITSLSIQFQREYNDYRDADNAIQGSRAFNPTAQLDFEAELQTVGVGELGGEHPGTEVASLNNYAGTVRGFDATSGALQHQDATNTQEDGEIPTTSFSIRHLPHAA